MAGEKSSWWDSLASSASGLASTAGDFFASKNALKGQKEIAKAQTAQANAQNRWTETIKGFAPLIIGAVVLLVALKLFFGGKKAA